MKDEELVRRIVECVGGRDNIRDVTNCMTRLRMEVCDDAAVRRDELEKLEGVLGIVSDRANRLEIVLSPGRCRKCADICKQAGIAGDGDWRENKAAVKAGQRDSVVRTALKSFGDIFVPLIPGVIAAGFCAGLAMLIEQLVPGYKNGGFWGIANALLSLFNKAFMTYITAWTGYRAAEKFGATPILGGMLGMVTGLDGINDIAKILHMWNDAEPLNSALRTGRGGVLAVIIGVWCLAFVEKAVRKRMPESLDIVFTPLVTLIVCSIPYILLIMPAMGYVSTFIAWSVEKACMSNSVIVRLIVGYIATALFLPLVAMGMHHGLVAIYSVQLASQGYVTLYPSLAMAGAGQVGAAIAIYYLAKRAENKRLCRVISGSLPAGILGIGEPLIYGVTLPMGKPFITAGLGAGFGGAFVMLTQVAATTWGPSGALGFFVMTAGPNGPIKSMLFYGIGLLISCAMGGMITWFALKESDVSEKEAKTEKTRPNVEIKERRHVSHGETILSSNAENSYTIRDEVGIHARPAAALVELVKKFDCSVKLSANGKTVAADSIINIMSLGAVKGTNITFEAEGPEHEAACRAIRRFFSENL